MWMRGMRLERHKKKFCRKQRKEEWKEALHRAERGHLLANQFVSLQLPCSRASVLCYLQRTALLVANTSFHKRQRATLSSIPRSPAAKAAVSSAASCFTHTVGQSQGCNLPFQKFMQHRPRYVAVPAYFFLKALFSMITTTNVLPISPKSLGSRCLKKKG